MHRSVSWNVSESMTKTRDLYPRSTAIALYAAIVLTALLEVDTLWGLDALRGGNWPLFLAASTALVSILLSDRLQAYCLPILQWIPFPVLPFFVLGISLGLPSSVHLLGDGYLLIRELDAEAWDRLDRADRAPLTFWLLSKLQRALSVTATELYVWISTLSGVAYALCIPLAVRSMTNDRSRQTVLAVSMLSTGCLMHFCGYVENYAPLLPGILLLIFCTCRVSRLDIGMWKASILLAVLTCLHFTAATFFPGLFAAALIASRSRGFARPIIDLALYPLLTVVILSLIGFDFAAYWGKLRSHTLPMTGAPTATAAHNLLSLEHLYDLLNVALLVCPTALILLPVFKPSWIVTDPIAKILACLCIGPLAFVLVANPEIGAFRDWDVLSLPAVPLIALTWYVWTAQQPRTQTVLLVSGVCLIHAIIWLSVNATPESAVNRYERLMRSASLSTHGKVYGWETLATYRRETGDAAGAIEAYQEALRARPDHPRILLLLGNAYQEKAQWSQAINAYQRTLEIQPESKEALSNLGVIEVRKGANVEAVALFNRAIAIDPDYAEAHMNRGVALANLGLRADAITSLRRAVDIDPSYVNAYRNLSALYTRWSQPDSARYFDDQAKRLYP
ncbi:MAG: hypothetical protein CME21_09895 [Gemmatimonadetes bacterium]|nr:hypothetical protein [Gemmatimonadota bacterium]